MCTMRSMYERFGVDWGMGGGVKRPDKFTLIVCLFLRLFGNDFSLICAVTLFECFLYQFFFVIK